jgi:hypothetical protein
MSQKACAAMDLIRESLALTLALDEKQKPQLDHA